MQRIASLMLALGLLATAVPAGAGPGATAYSQVVESLIATYGFVPPTALLNGVEVPTEQALALLRANAAPLPQGEGFYGPPDDLAYSVRQGAGPCLVAAILTAYAFGIASEEALVDEEEVGVPGGTAACGFGFPYTLGEGGARVAETADFAVVCAQGWLSGHEGCYTAPEAATMVGRVGFVDIEFRAFGTVFHIEQLFAGVMGTLPGPLGATDAALVAAVLDP